MATIPIHQHDLPDSSEAFGAYPLYHGHTVTVDEYNALPNDGHDYEVIDGVMMLMPDRVPESFEPNLAYRVPQYQGMRATADEFLALPNDGFKYELVNGVVFMSPSPSAWHQAVVVEIITQFGAFLRTNPIGKLLVETDITFVDPAAKERYVYRPEIVFLRKEHVPAGKDRIAGSPDIVVEVVSPTTRKIDNVTKRRDYERFGVEEYWLIDPLLESMTFLHNDNGKYVDMAADAHHYESKAAPGFVLDLSLVRKSFRPW